MSVKKLEQQKKQMQKQLAELNEQIANNVRPKLEEVVELLEAHQDAVAQDKGIERLTMKLSRLVFGIEVKKGSPREGDGNFSYFRLVAVIKGVG